jgi:two-component system LytT family response regulator
LRLTDIDLAEASDNYVKLYAGGDSYMFRETLTALEEKLSPERFLRISRSIIVNIESRQGTSANVSWRIRGIASLTAQR